MLIIRVICKECYVKQYGTLPERLIYKKTKEISSCELCGKKDYLIYITEKKNGACSKLNLFDI